MRYLLFMLFLFLVLPLQAQDKSVCDAHPELNLYATFGPECLNPVPYDLPGFVPIGTTVYFVTPFGAGQGKITGYYWYVSQQRYWYVVESTAIAGYGGWIVEPVAVRVGVLKLTVWLGVQSI